MQEFDFLDSGEVFDSRYRIVRQLGRGATGCVVHVEDLETKEGRALKILFPHLVTEDSTIERFRNEVRILRRISHENVLRVFNFHTSDTGFHYISMEYFDGGTLRERLEQDGGLPQDEVVPVLLSIARGMSAAHAEGIVHRDLKPDNILISEQGDVKIVDFGLAKALDENNKLTATGVGVGTPYYMSPEQLLGEPATEASDIYSFGIVGFHLLNGEPPYTGDSLVDLARQHIESVFPYERLQKVGCSPWLANLLGRCAEKKASKRCVSFDYVCSLLELKSQIVSRAQLSIVDNIEVTQDFYRHLYRNFFRPRKLPYFFICFLFIWLFEALLLINEFNFLITWQVFRLEKQIGMEIPGLRTFFIYRERSLEQLNKCIRSGEELCVDMLSETVDSLNAPDKNGDYPLLMAARYGTRDNLVKVLYNGGDPDVIDRQTGETAIFSAVRGGSFYMVRDLNRAGASIATINYSGDSVFTALFEDFENFQISQVYYPDAGAADEIDQSFVQHNVDVLPFLLKELLRYEGARELADRRGRRVEDFIEAYIREQGRDEFELRAILSNSLDKVPLTNWKD